MSHNPNIGERYINGNGIVLEIIQKVSIQEMKSKYPWLNEIGYQVIFIDSNELGYITITDLRNYYLSINQITDLNNFLKKLRRFVNMSRKWNEKKINEEAESLLNEFDERGINVNKS